MSAKLMGMVWDLDLPHVESKVLMVLCDHADDVPGQPGVGVHCFPSQRKIAWKTGYDRRAVQRALDRLEKKWKVILEVENGSGRSSSEYEIHLENGVKKVWPERRQDSASQGRQDSASQGRQDSASQGRQDSAGGRIPPAAPQPTQGRLSQPPFPPHVPTIYPPPLATTLFSHPGSPNNNVFETYISEVGKIFAHLPGAIPSQTDRQIVERWFASKVAIPTVKLGLVEGMLRHISGPNYDRTLNLAYFVPIVEEYAKSPRAVPPHLVDFRYTRLADYLKERPNFPRASWMIPELEEETSS